LRICFEKNRLVRKFVQSVLHFQWMSRDYPKLKYTSNKSAIFCGCPLFKIVPCAWASVLISFVVLVPGIICVKEGFLEFARSVPAVGLASFSFGKLYMQAANASFELWLSNSKILWNVRTIIETSRIFRMMSEHPDVIAVTEKELDSIIHNKALEERFHHFALDETAEEDKPYLQTWKHFTNIVQKSYEDQGMDGIRKKLGQYINDFATAKTIYIIEDGKDSGCSVDLTDPERKFRRWKSGAIENIRAIDEDGGVQTTCCFI